MKVKELIRSLTEMNMEDDVVILDTITFNKYGFNVCKNDGEVILETEPNEVEVEEEDGLIRKYRETIDEVINEFDFKGTNDMMKAMNWTWFDTQGVPEVADMKRLARNLLESAVQNYVNSGFSEKECIIETGGFRAVCMKDEDERVFSDDVILKLEFVYNDFTVASNGFDPCGLNGGF